MKRVLIITHAFPPSNDVAVHRVLRMGKWLPSYGWEPVILTSKYPFTERIDTDNLIFVEKYFKNVYRVAGLYESILLNLGERKKRNLLARAIRGGYLYRLNPNHSILWMKKAVSEGLKIIKEQNIDAIWATIGPPTSGLVGAELKKISNVPLLIDYRDPWTLNPYLNYTGEKLQRNIELEKEMLTQADTVIATSESIKERLVNNGYSDPGNTFVITNGFDEELQWISNDVDMPLIDKDKFNITYTGAFYGDRQPFGFIEGLTFFLEKYPEYKYKIRFNIVGNQDPTNNILSCMKNKGLEKMLFETGIVSYRTAMQYLRQSNLLLLINGTNPESKIFIPGKLFDYIAAGKPIYFIGDGQPKYIVERINAGYTSNHEPYNVQNSLETILLKNKQNMLYNDFTMNYKSENITKEFSALLKKIL